MKGLFVFNTAASQNHNFLSCLISGIFLIFEKTTNKIILQNVCYYKKSEALRICIGYSIENKEVGINFWYNWKNSVTYFHSTVVCTVWKIF